jgi:pimeloyl-ACP methyl ester carboxylesterase
MNAELSLNYRVAGEGHPIVFVHGFLENNSMWERAVHFHSEFNKCILIELYGHGKSKMPNSLFTIKSLAAEVINLIHSITNEKYSFVGHSLGGYVGLEILNNPNNRVHNFILLNSHPWEDSSEKKTERTRLSEIVIKNKSLFIQQAIPQLFKDPIAHQVVIDQLITDAKAMTEDAISKMTIAMRDRFDLSHVLIQNNGKSLVIQGEHDHLIPYKNMKRFCSQNNIPFRLVKGSDHMCWVNDTIYPLI